MTETLSGSWTGRFDYDNITLGTPVSFDAVLTQTGNTLRGEVVEPNTFRSEATDTLLAVLTGSRNGSNVQFVKTYTDLRKPNIQSTRGKSMRRRRGSPGVGIFRECRG